MNNATFPCSSTPTTSPVPAARRIAQPAPAVRDRRRRGADALVQLASVAHMTGARASVELPVLAIERLRDALDTLSGYDETWLQVLEPAEALVRDIGHRRHALH